MTQRNEGGYKTGDLFSILPDFETPSIENLAGEVRLSDFEQHFVTEHNNCNLISS